MTPLFHLESNPPPQTRESARFPKHVSPDESPACLLKIGKLFRALFRLRDVDVLLFIIIEVTRVSGSSALWQEGRLDLRGDNIHD